MASIIDRIPEAAWTAMGNTLVNQVCNLTYYDKNNGDKDLKRHPKREMLNIITEFLQNNINLRDANADEKFKVEFFKNIADSINPCIAKMYENDLMAIRCMEGILNEYPYILMNIINIIAAKSSDEADESTEKKESFITIFMRKITTYINVDNEISKNINKDTEPVSAENEDSEKLYEMENEDISGVQDTLVTNIKKYGFLKNADNIDHLKKVSNDEVIKHIDSLIDTIVSTDQEKENIEAANSPLAAFTQMMPDTNPLSVLIKEAVGDMPEQFVERVFATLEKSDAKQYSEIKEDIYKTILSALRYHLGKPEGRQIYLRQIEPIVRNYAVKSLINDDTTIICIFQLIRDSPKINKFIRKTVEIAYKNKNTNFTNPSFQDMRKFTGGAMPNPFKVFRDKTEPFVNKVLGKTPVSAAPDSTAPDSAAPDSTAPDSTADVIDEPYDMSKIISEYKNTFAYDVYQLLDTEIQSVIKGNDPIAKMYNDLEQFKVPKLAKLNKNAIDYAKTMCSPGIMKKEIAQSKSTYRKPATQSVENTTQSVENTTQSVENTTQSVENTAQSVENTTQSVENTTQSVEPITGYAAAEEMSTIPPAPGDTATPPNLEDAQKQVMSGVEDMINQGKGKVSELYKTSPNLADAQKQVMSGVEDMMNKGKGKVSELYKTAPTLADAQKQAMSPELKDAAKQAMSAMPTTLADAKKQAMSALPPDAQKKVLSSLPPNAQNLANKAMSFLNTPKKGGNIHKTYRKMIEKRHKYTRKI